MLARLTPRLTKYIPHKPTPKQTVFLLLNDRREMMFGGSAGGGKSDALLMAALQYVDVSGYAALILRRTYKDLSLPEAIMDRCHRWLRSFVSSGDVYWNETKKTYIFPSGATLTFGYLASENDKYQYQGCFHPNTEMLTQQGWKPVSDVTIGESVATLNPVTREMEYRPVTETWRYPFDGDMTVVYQEKGVAFCVTPNHKVWASTNRVPALRAFEAKDLPYTARIPQWAIWKGVEPPQTITFASDGARGKTLTFQIQDWLELLGWYIAEGSCYGGGKYQIRLTQINADGREWIEALLARMGINFHTRDRSFEFNNKAVYQYVKNLGTSHYKHIPPAIKQYPPDYLRILLNSLVEGDGTWYDDHDQKWGHFVSSSKQLADDVCEIAVKCGYRPTISLRQGNPEGTKFGTRPRWHVFLNRVFGHDTWLCGKIGTEHYTGDVVCVTVPPYHTILIRYRGRVSWSGQSELQFVGFDELTQFSETQYAYLFSRLRRKEGVTVPLRMRSATNPGGFGHQWVKQRFIIEGMAKGRVFVPARLSDNPFVDQESYLESLQNLDHITRAQLLNGDWDANYEGTLFKPFWFEIIEREALPRKLRKVRRWDLAATEPNAENQDPDYTSGLLMARDDEGTYYVIDVRRIRATPHKVEQFIAQTAQIDGKDTKIRMEMEGGAAGVANIDRYSRYVLDGYDFQGVRPVGDKEVRARPVSAKSEQGHIKLVSGAWISDFLGEICSFPNTPHDDQVDAFSGAYEDLAFDKPVAKRVSYGGLYASRNRR